MEERKKKTKRFTSKRFNITRDLRELSCKESERGSIKSYLYL